MPIRNITRETALPQYVFIADTFMRRLAGLLGSDEPDVAKIVYFLPSQSIHSFGMKYALDVAFLDHENRVIKIFRYFPPNRTTGSVSKAHAAIEGPSGVFDGITEGDRLDVTADFPLDGVMKGVQRILHWPVNISLVLLWSNFISAAYHRWTTGEGINIGLVIVNTVFMVFFLTRRESRKTASRFQN